MAELSEDVGRCWKMSENVGNVSEKSQIIFRKIIFVYLVSWDNWAHPLPLIKMNIFIPLSPRLFTTKVCEIMKMDEGRGALLPNNLKLDRNIRKCTRVKIKATLYISKRKKWTSFFFLLVKIL